MRAGWQAFRSGAISKTVNLPTDASVEEVMNTYIEGWRMGLKAIAIYRDGSKRSAPLNTKKTKDMGGDERGTSSVEEIPPLKARIAELEQGVVTLNHPSPKRMPDTRVSLTHKFEIAGHDA